jgi:hypothetical protein
VCDVVFTAIYGGYDPLRPVPDEARREGLRYLCFTDDPHLWADGWEVIHLPLGSPPWMAAKAVKILGRPLPPETERSIWLDASLVFSNDSTTIFDEFSTDLGLFRHWRGCLYHEAKRCKQRRKDDPERIEAQVSRYREAGHPPRWGLWMGGFLFRRHTPAIATFNELWWAEICQTTRRDQISLPFILRTTCLEFTTIPGHLRGEYFRLRPHNRRRRLYATA